MTAYLITLINLQIQCEMKDFQKQDGKSCVEKRIIIFILKMSTATVDIATKFLVASYPSRLKFKLLRASCVHIACRNQVGL